MKIMLSAILRNYKVFTDLTIDQMVPKWGITLKMENEHSIRIVPRDFKKLPCS